MAAKVAAKEAEGDSDEPLQRALFITAVYAVLGTAWIFGSDYLASLVSGEAADFAMYQRIKGLVYVLITAILLFTLIYHALRSLRASEREVSRGTLASHELGAYLKAIIRATPVAVFDLGPNGVVHSIWNPAAAKLFGYTSDEVLGYPAPMLSAEHLALIDQIREGAQKQRGAPLVDAELVRKDASSFPAVLAAARVDHADGRVTVVIVNDLSQTRRTLDLLEAALDEREVLLREIHHRVKNNLQIVCSLLVLERGAASADDAQQLGLTRALARIRTISRIHEQFYQGDDLTSVDLADYLRGLAGEIVSSYASGRKIRVETRLDAVELDFDRTIPVGLILHELLAISCSHDFPASEPSVVTVSLVRSPVGITLSVADNAVDAGWLGDKESDALAPLIVRTLTEQIRGTLTAGIGRGISILIPGVLTTPSKAK